MHAVCQQIGSNNTFWLGVRMPLQQAENVRKNNDPCWENQNQDSLLLKLSSHVVSYDNRTSHQDNLSHVTSYETIRIHHRALPQTVCSWRLPGVIFK
jgi:hypothetical protein